MRGRVRAGPQCHTTLEKGVAVVRAGAEAIQHYHTQYWFARLTRMPDGINESLISSGMRVKTSKALGTRLPAAFLQGYD